MNFADTRRATGSQVQFVYDEIATWLHVDRLGRLSDLQAAFPGEPVVYQVQPWRPRSLIELPEEADGGFTREPVVRLARGRRVTFVVSDRWTG